MWYDIKTWQSTTVRVDTLSMLPHLLSQPSVVPLAVSELLLCINEIPMSVVRKILDMTLEKLQVYFTDDSFVSSTVSTSAKSRSFDKSFGLNGSVLNLVMLAVLM